MPLALYVCIYMQLIGCYVIVFIMNAYMFVYCLYTERHFCLLYSEINSCNSFTIISLQKAATWNPLHKCLGYNIDTLLWLDGSRSFSSVGYMDTAGAVTVLSDVFPNSKYGYNKRNFLVGVLPV